MPDVLTPAQFVAHSLVPGTGNVHVLGSFEKRVTLWSQQHRALNLVYALHHEGLLGPGKHVAVVGGGVAGLTAAAAAAQKGAQVTVLERQSELLHLLQGNHTRWVHPRIYDWPLPGSEEAHAGLPLLDWEAGLAGDVCEQILTGFHRAAPGCRILCGVEDLQIAEGPGPRRRLHWTAGSEDFDLVIFAVGFGIERTVENLLLVSYWRDDSLHQPEVEPGTRIHLVSGCGDGGLTDLLRLRLTQFRHEHMVREFASGADLEVLKRSLLEIEQALPGQPEATRAVWLAARYEALPVPPSLDETLRERLRERTTVVLNGPGVNLFDAGSAVLNRFLVWRLVTLGAVTYLPGKISRVERAGPGYEVHFEASPPRRFDLAGRVDVFPMGRQPDAKIEQLILQGERAANLVFVRRSEFVLESLGSFYTAQQLCLSAAGEHGIEETMATLTPIDAGPRDVIPDLMNELDRVFAQPLLGFAALDHGAPRRGACLALLWLLSRAQSGHVLLTRPPQHSRPSATMLAVHASSRTAPARARHRVYAEQADGARSS